MAYKKTLELPSGFTAEYWRIVKVDANKIIPNIEVLVYGYKDKASRDAGKSHVAMKEFTISTSDLDFSTDIFEQAYVLIKDKIADIERFNANATPFFANALDA